MVARKKAHQKTTSKKPATNSEDPILTLTDAGKQLGRSTQTITRWIQQRLIEAVNLPGGRWGVRQSEVDKYLGSPFDGGNGS